MSRPLIGIPEEQMAGIRGNARDSDLLRDREALGKSGARKIRGQAHDFYEMGYSLLSGVRQHFASLLRAVARDRHSGFYRYFSLKSMYSKPIEVF